MGYELANSNIYYSTSFDLLLYFGKKKKEKINEKLSRFVVVGLLLSGNAYANLLSFKKYAKCEYKSQVENLNLVYI